MMLEELYNKMQSVQSITLPGGSSTGIYLLVMTVWDRQDGANTALQPRIEEQPLTFYSVFSLLPPPRGRASLRDIPQRVLDLFAEVLNVLPLFLRQALPAHVDVLNLQLLLIKQPLHKKHRRYTGKNDRCDPIFQYR